VCFTFSLLGVLLFKEPPCDGLLCVANLNTPDCERLPHFLPFRLTGTHPLPGTIVVRMTFKNHVGDRFLHSSPFLGRFRKGNFPSFLPTRQFPSPRSDKSLYARSQSYLPFNAGKTFRSPEAFPSTLSPMGSIPFGSYCDPADHLFFLFQGLSPSHQVADPHGFLSSESSFTFFFFRPMPSVVPFFADPGFNDRNRVFSKSLSSLLPVAVPVFAMPPNSRGLPLKTDRSDCFPCAPFSARVSPI